MKTGGSDSMEQWMRDINKRLSRLEQRPRGSTTATLLGAVQAEEEAVPEPDVDAPERP